MGLLYLFFFYIDINSGTTTKGNFQKRQVLHHLPSRGKFYEEKKDAIYQFDGSGYVQF